MKNLFIISKINTLKDRFYTFIYLFVPQTFYISRKERKPVG